MLPVFHNRNFGYSRLRVREGSGINGPEDLKGKRIGSADYQQTASLWIRGIFQHEFDHLNGSLFLDRLRGLKRQIIVRKINKLRRTGKW